MNKFLISTGVLLASLALASCSDDTQSSAPAAPAPPLSPQRASITRWNRAHRRRRRHPHRRPQARSQATKSRHSR